MYLFLKQTSKPYSLLGYKVEIYEVEESFTSLKLRFKKKMLLFTFNCKCSFKKRMQCKYTNTEKLC